MTELEPRLTPARCAEMLGASRRLVVLTGAGVSTAAGIPDFRGPHGIYVTRRYDPEKVFELSAFLHDPEPFFDFTRDFMEMAATIEPTFTHRFLARLEARGRLEALVTQNIDTLHQDAGSRAVIPLHGCYWSSHCLACHQSFDLPTLKKLIQSMPVARCSCGGVVKPDVVFFGEPVHAMDEAAAASARADLMMVLGSSLTVYPAALLPQYASCAVMVVNRGPVGLAEGPGRHFADADLDSFFTEVAELL